MLSILMCQKSNWKLQPKIALRKQWCGRNVFTSIGLAIRAVNAIQAPCLKGDSERARETLEVSSVRIELTIAADNYRDPEFHNAGPVHEANQMIGASLFGSGYADLTRQQRLTMP
jgi:hypothetical protein